MGGISTSVVEEEKDYVIRTKVGKDRDEFMVTRHSHFFQPLNIINIYGEHEGRETNANVESTNRWFRILEEIVKIENRCESLISIGDLNKKIGNGNNGIQAVAAPMSNSISVRQDGLLTPLSKTFKKN